MIAKRAPTRIDFGGGWTDVPPYSHEEGGFVCNVAISRYATVRLAPHSAAETNGRVTISVDRASDRALVQAAVTRLGAHELAVSLHNDFPIAAGLGGSSAAGVATVAALTEWAGLSLARDAIAELSRDIETVELGIPGGRQDHYAAAFGGALALRFGETVECTGVPLTTRVRQELARRCLIVYTGESRISGNTILAVLGAYRDREPRVLTALQRMRELAERMPAVLAAGQFDDLGALVAEQWAHQRSLHPAIPTPRIDTIIERAGAAGAVGAKALGASGGGCVLVVAASDTVDAVRAAIAPLGDIIDYAVDEGGVTSCA